MRLVFMGSPDFAVPSLKALLDAGHEVAAVYCQPPRPAGRGQAVRRCAVHAAADALGLPVRTPARLRHATDEHTAFAALEVEAAVVAAYGLLLPPAILDAPARGCLNVHASLLPRWRGAAPIQAAILAGDRESGVTIMQMDAGLDTGPMLARTVVPLTDRSTAADLHDSLARAGAALLLRVLTEAPAPVPQPEAGATYAAKLTRQDGRIDWSHGTLAIDRRVRALNPWPGTFTLLDGTLLKVLDAQPSALAEVAAQPGTTLDAGLSVATGDGAIVLTRVQPAGRPAMDAAAFLRGRPVAAGQHLG